MYLVKFYFFKLMKRVVWVTFLVGLVSCKKQDNKLFTEVPFEQSKVTFVNQLRSAPELNILNYIYYYNGAGVATGDFNNDGLEDLFFTANEGKHEFYLNKGELLFQNVTRETGIEESHPWTTGVTAVDINNDGLLDLYICKVSGIQNLTGHNLLYINKGSTKGIPRFEEESKKYGLDFSGLSTQSTFFDYDQDGDLDMFLLNHSVHPNQNYGKGQQRLIPNDVSGDRLYENVEGHFQDVTFKSRIYQSKIGYGLSLSVSDVNNDNLPDIYVGNDFFENDYLYINNGNRTFKEIISEDVNTLGHTTHYSMGNAIADYNNDGNTDIFSLDMLPENLETYKSSGTEYSYPTYNNYLNNGYRPQFMQNSLHLNSGNTTFSEIAHLANISATEWSWGVLLADFDNDGYKDAFITNGIKGASNDMDFINFIANDNIQKQLGDNMSEQQMKFIAKMPEKKVTNYFFKNKGDLTFDNVSATWADLEKSFSNGCVYSDLDNDGDLDIVVNNVNERAYILENHTNEALDKNYLKIKFKGNKTNVTGIGAKVFVYAKGELQTYENYTTKGYLSSVSATLHFGLGSTKELDSLKVVWPNGLSQTKKNILANQLIILNIESAVGSRTTKTNTFSGNKGLIPFKHNDGSSLEFYRDPLIPYATTNEGPAIAISDINLDGTEDVFIGGAKQQSSGLFLQGKDGKFKSTQPELFEQDKVNEDVSQVFFDANGDAYPDLLVVSGGNEFKKGKQLNPRLYINDKGLYRRDTTAFKEYQINASKVKTWDFENDGDQDIIIISDAVPWEFGITPKQFLFVNDGKGNFKEVTQAIAPQLLDLGIIKDVLIKDLDGNGFLDLVFVGHWMPITIFMNDGSALSKVNNKGLETSNGLWNSIAAEDLDGDGDPDFVVGNWGLNSKLKATTQEPITLYKVDIDDNGNLETIVTYFHNGIETVLASKDELTKQIPSLNKNYLSYTYFSKATVDELFPNLRNQNQLQKKVFELASCYFENLGNGSFRKIKLPKIAQVSNIEDILIETQEGQNKLILIGNNHEISTQLGRMDASHGIILYPSIKQAFTTENHENLGVGGAARSIEQLSIGDTNGYIITINNDSILFIPKEHKK